ncbi:MAG: nucleotidyl transferase AbiEii/AbiGii toxin family protein [Candidatus Cloacimonetes bacterium]|nr:nucleotidyl transferase AbiEii/AbiGii toxin family protein [Candidatus Cloacimonadota bacterium]
MIDTASYSREWLASLRAVNKGIDPSLCEKLIRALGLLEELVTKGLDFVFKGGTVLILLIEKPERFSIDIDINTEESKESVEAVIENIMKTGIFKRSVEKKRPFRGVPKAHYYFYYDSLVNGKEAYVMLDVLFDTHSYHRIIETPIQSHWIKTQGTAITVKTPDIDSLLGEKLTVFAPNTTGIKYNTGKSMEIIKQLFDISRLFDHISDLQTVKTSFKQTAIKGLAYRKLELSPLDVLNDIIDISLIISRFPGGGKYNTAELLELIEGLKSFSSFPIAVKYRSDSAILSASKAAYLATLIAHDENDLQYYKGDAEPAQLDFPDKFKHINKLKRRLPDACYYWCKAIKILTEKEA